MPPASRGARRQGRSLGQKILVPFFLILSLLGAGATVVSVVLIQQALSRTADQRLQAFREVVFREIKKQEILLASFAEIVQYTHHLSRADADRSRILEDHFYRSLQTARVNAAFYPLEARQDFPYESMRRLFDQAFRSGESRFRFLSPPGATPVLAVAAPVNDAQGKITQFLLLETPIDESYLHQLAEPFGAHLYLFSMDGGLLAADPGVTSPPELSREQLGQVLGGQKIFLTKKEPFPIRFLYYAVPLGTTDILVLALELPMADLGELVDNMATGSVLAISLALLLGGYIYYRIIRQIIAPTEELLNATQAISRGNLDYRVDYQGRDELGRLGEAFNRMTAELKNLTASRIEQEKQLALAEESLRYKEMVEEKNREIERTNRELKTHLKELSALFQLNQAMISSLDTGILFDRVIQVLKDLLQCDELVLLLYNPGGEELEIRKTHGIAPETLKEVSFRLDEGITGLAAREQKLYYVPDLAGEQRNLRYKGKISLRGSMVSVPMVVKKRLKGVLNIHKARIDSFSKTEISLIQAVANQAAIALENAQLYEQARNLSNTDELTGLANRRYFQEILQRELAQGRRYNSSFSVIMADIDHFKHYNDLHGHLQGDLVLKRVASILLQNTRGIDLVARFGGEEFVILLPKTVREGALAAAEKLRHCVAAESFPGAETSQPGGRLTLSLGVSEFPSDSKEAYELLDLADRALYRAKERGRNCSAACRQTSSSDSGAQPSA